MAHCYCGKLTLSIATTALLVLLIAVGSTWKQPLANPSLIQCSGTGVPNIHDITVQNTVTPGCGNVSIHYSKFLKRLLLGNIVEVFWKIHSSYNLHQSTDTSAYKRIANNRQFHACVNGNYCQSIQRIWLQAMAKWHLDCFLFGYFYKPYHPHSAQKYMAIRP